MKYDEFSDLENQKEFQDLNEFNDSGKDLNIEVPNPIDDIEKNEEDNYNLSEDNFAYYLKKLLTPTTIAVAAIIAFAGGAVVSSTNLTTSKNSSLNISMVDDTSVIFNYQTKENDLKVKLSNDYITIIEPLDFTEVNSDGYYTGTFSFDNLKHNTQYKISLINDSAFGDYAVTSISFRTKE